MVHVPMCKQIKNTIILYIPPDRGELNLPYLPICIGIHYPHPDIQAAIYKFPDILGFPGVSVISINQD